MRRADLLRQIRGARGPRRCATALDTSREWLRKHPEDVEVGFAMLDLLRVGARRPHAVRQGR